MDRGRLVSIVVAVLAIVQGVLGVLRAFRYFHMGAELAGQGLIVMPLIGAVLYSRGAVIVMVAFLSFIFVTGLLLSKSWGWWCGLIAAVLNVLLVLGLLIEGDRIAELIFWLVVPVLVLWFLFSRYGWRLDNGSDQTASS